MRNVPILILILLVKISFGEYTYPVSICATESGWNEAGVRSGLPVSSRHGNFSQYEAFALYGLPCNRENVSGWSMSPHINTSLGVLTDRNETGLIASLGAAMVLNKQDSGASTELGINTNLLDRRTFGSVDFGSILQFGAYLGIHYRLHNGPKIGYRIQHMSNGHIFIQTALQIQALICIWPQLALFFRIEDNFLYSHFPGTNDRIYQPEPDKPRHAISYKGNHRKAHNLWAFIGMHHDRGTNYYGGQDHAG